MRKHVREVEVAAVGVVVLRACVCVGYMQYDMIYDIYSYIHISYSIIYMYDI